LGKQRAESTSRIAKYTSPAGLSDKGYQT